MISLVEFYGENLATINQVEFKLQTCRPVCMSFTLEGHGEHYTHPQQRQPKEGKASLHFLHVRRPIPSNANLKKERPVCISFMFEGHGDHYIQYPQGLRVNYGVVLLLCVLSLMAGSTAGVVMSPWYGGNQTTTPPASYKTYATTSSYTEVFKDYTTKGPEFYTTTYAAPSHYTDALKYYSAPSYYTTKATEHDYACCPILLHRGSQVLLCSQLLIEAIFLNTTLFPAATPRLPLITPLKRSNTTPKRRSTTLPRSKQPQLRRPSITQSRLCYTKVALSCYVEQQYYTDAPVQYTTTYATPQAPSTTPKKPPITQQLTTPSLPSTTSLKAPEFYTSMYAAPAYYTEARHYYNTDALQYYTTTYAAPSHYTDALKYYSALSYYTI
ncbi:hypothetical protein DAPPUDRAFT_240075 [Daphnia pulex]|uniref:Uncharacterized protein n=1 Tax=Daphnia pulex TaxID=6669 RepID=E9GAT3_DAPPU|nr:hypothetical protein DAPPUDRAFT_240075 [Daphnia pulex]|eukprot:EFX83487.1 hypothetical protein DAPPUDRAFT_240075 [Daphnia pulex]